MNMSEDASDFREESQSLANAWMRHDEEFLASYLKLSVQNPGFNPQSILTRYAILEYLCDEDISEMKYNELLFSAVMLWVYQNMEILDDPYERKSLQYALETGAESTETIRIPRILKEAWSRIIIFKGEKILPTYLKKILNINGDNSGIAETKPGIGDISEREINYQRKLNQEVATEFLDIWRRLLPSMKIRRGDVLEPACGAANDYSAIRYMGLDKFINYQGFDICEKNVKVARSLYQDANITIGNIYDEAFGKNYDVIYVHDLFEHLSEKGVGFSIEKLCRHCDGVLCLNFFNMEEIPEHIIRSVAGYHWNTLSRPKICELIESFGFDVQTINILSFFRDVYCLEPEIATEEFYNPRAHTLICRKRKSRQ